MTKSSDIRSISRSKTIKYDSFPPLTFALDNLDNHPHICPSSPSLKQIAGPEPAEEFVQFGCCIPGCNPVMAGP